MKYFGSTALVQAISLAIFVSIAPHYAQADLRDDAAAAYERHDYARAADIWSKLAEQGDPSAAFKVGSMYLHGRGVEQDIPKGRTLLEFAAKKGLAEAQHSLGACYLAGTCGERNLSKAVYWLEKCADQGYAPCQLGSAQILWMIGGEADRVVALKWLYLALQNPLIGSLRERSLQLKDQFEEALTQQDIDAARSDADDWLPITSSSPLE